LCALIVTIFQSNPEHFAGDGLGSVGVGAHRSPNQPR
jgi:hypothetical protein